MTNTPATDPALEIQRITVELRDCAAQVTHLDARLNDLTAAATTLACRLDALEDKAPAPAQDKPSPMIASPLLEKTTHADGSVSWALVELVAGKRHPLQTLAPEAEAEADPASSSAFGPDRFVIGSSAELAAYKAMLKAENARLDWEALHAKQLRAAAEDIAPILASETQARAEALEALDKALTPSASDLTPAPSDTPTTADLLARIEALEAMAARRAPSPSVEAGE